MAVKCNIIDLAQERVRLIKWRFSCRDNSRWIIENYVEYLNCPEVNLVPCGTVNCQEGGSTVSSACTLVINEIAGEVIVDQGRIYFSVLIDGYVGGTLPFSYSWTYNTDDFELVAGATVNEPELRLALKPGRDSSYLNTDINVTITDANGCEVTKGCFYTPSGMECDLSVFTFCPNTRQLEVVN